MAASFSASSATQATAPPSAPRSGPKRLLFGLLLLLLLAPALQAKFHWVKVAPLDGFFDENKHPDFAWEDLRNGTYQPRLEAYLEENLGFRSWFLRLHNQLVYSLFNQTTISTVVAGKDDVLFQPLSIDVYQGLGYAPAEMDNRVRWLRTVQDSLRAHGTQFLLVMAPGKARILPHLLPEHYAKRPVKPSNYDAVLQATRKYGVNVLDAAALMLRWQDTTKYPLFPRGGTHWSGYATALMADTMFRQVERLTQLDLPDFASRGRTIVTSPDSIRFTDDDIQKILNRMWEVAPYPMAYPNVQFAADSATKKKANALIIGDSFAQSFYNFYPYYQRLFTPEARYWAGNEYVFWPEKAPGSHTVKDLDLKQELQGRDIVIIICTEQNLGQLGFGFINSAYRMYRPRTAADEAAINQLAQELEKKASWEEISNDPNFARTVHYKAEAIYDETH
ncbi:alginate O-acetyltransferase AlgX-related protein [Hymenobacter sp. APR13]|uniref:alginate O-acetyltransferase AlgX-related protein n=1 Tax=Hymenobacter sp. APR13 TaxID=1356852 RepID=UPI0009E0A52C|nr:hypothetical protein [Hymenobacter sp. APR13]